MIFLPMLKTARSYLHSFGQNIITWRQNRSGYYRGLHCEQYGWAVIIIINNDPHLFLVCLFACTPWNYSNRGTKMINTIFVSFIIHIKITLYHVHWNSGSLPSKLRQCDSLGEFKRTPVRGPWHFVTFWLRAPFKNHLTYTCRLLIIAVALNVLLYATMPAFMTLVTCSHTVTNSLCISLPLRIVLKYKVHTCCYVC